MSTLNNIELLIITIVLSLYFIFSTVLVVYLIKFVKKLNILYQKVDSLVNSAQSVVENVQKMAEKSRKRMPFMNFINHLFDMVSNGKEK